MEPETQEFHILQWFTGGHLELADAISSLDVEWGRTVGNWSGPLTIAEVGDLDASVTDSRLVVTGLSGTSVATALRRVLEPFRALLETMTGGVAAPVAVLLTLAAGRVIQVHWTSRDGSLAPERSEGVFDHSRLRSFHVNRWFEVSSKTHPILSVASRALIGHGSTLEANAMTLAAVAEGLHEQLHGARAIEKSTVKQIRNAASAAVPEEYRNRVFGALGQLGKPSFRDRLEWLAGNLEPLATDLCGATATTVGAHQEDQADQGVSAKPGKSPRVLLLEKLMTARNSFAHQKPGNPEDLDHYVERALALRDVARWFVAACILRELEIPVEDIDQEFKRRSSFHLSMRRARRVFPEVYGTTTENDDDVLFDVEVEE